MSRQPVFEYHAESIKIPIELPNGKSKIIQIDSGYAFGTGNHHTTKLCLNMIQSLYKETTLQNVLDVGCGSGILAIAAVVLGAKSATALDIESSVIQEAKKNVDQNGFSSQIEVHNKEIYEIDDNYDLVIANILTEQIVKISDKLVSRLNKNGLLIVSGLRSGEKQIIIDEFSELETNFTKILTEDDWCSLLFYKQ